MIKRFWFEPMDAWRQAPGAAAPLRATGSTALADLDPDPPFQEITTAWFADLAHLERFDRWSGDRGPTLAAEEVVVRGEGWLAERWADGGPRLKHLALARRATGLTAEDFSARWRSHAGTVGATPIPEVARGRAYVQDHSLAGNGPYDAISEVWFDDIDALRTRVAWMAEALAIDPPDDLFGERHLVAMQEVVLSRGEGA